MLMILCQIVRHHGKRTNLKVCHVGSKTRSLGQILKNRVHSGRHFDPICMKLCQIVCHHEIWDKFETGSCRVKNRSSDQILENRFFTIKV